MTTRRQTDINILRLALPAVLSNITVPLLGLSDTFISSHLGSERYIAAIAVGTTMTSSLYWLFGFLRMGTTGLTAEAFGADDNAQRQRIFTTAFLLAIAIGLAMIALCHPLGRLLVWLTSPPPQTAALASRYFTIITLSAPALLATMTITGWMIGCQNTVYPMIVAICVNVVNIALSFSLVFGAGTGFTGVAVGTAAANWIGLLLALMLARRLNGDAAPLWCPLRSLRGQFDTSRFFKVNSDLMIRSACIMAISYGMTYFGGRQGDLTLAVNAIIMQFFLLFSYFMDGFAFSGEAMCGRYAGAADAGGLRLTVARLSLWCGVTAVTFLAVYAAFGSHIVAWLTDIATVAEGVDEMRWAVCMLPVASVAAFMLDGVYIGLTATRRMLVSTFAAMAVYFAVVMAAPLVPAVSGIRPNHVLWAAFLTALLTRGLILSALLPSTASAAVGRRK